MYDVNNVFAKIIRGELIAKVVYEDAKVLAFHDVAPVAPIHVLVIPKGQYVNYDDFIGKAQESDVLDFFLKIRVIAQLLKVDSEYRLLTNSGTNSGQTVPHFHMHIISGKKLQKF